MQIRKKQIVSVISQCQTIKTAPEREETKSPAYLQTQPYLLLNFKLATY